MRKRLLAGFIIFFKPSVPLADTVSTHTLPQLQNIVYLTEIKFHLPPNLLDSIIWQESTYRINAFNSARNKGVSVSSYGLGQLTLDTAKTHCRLIRKYIYYPRKNIECSGKVLSYQLKRYKGDMLSAVAAYNWGTPCRCNGVFYEKKLKKKIVPCLKWDYKKLIKVPITCKKQGTFYNQVYVDEVINRRQKIRQKIYDLFKKPTFAIIKKI